MVHFLLSDNACLGSIKIKFYTSSWNNNVKGGGGKVEKYTAGMCTQVL